MNPWRLARQGGIGRPSRQQGQIDTCFGASASDRSRQPVNRSPARPAHRPCARSCHAAQRNNRHFCIACQHTKPRRAQHVSAWVRARRKDRRNQHSIRAFAARLANFAQIMRRCELDEAASLRVKRQGRAIDAVCAPFPRRLRAICQYDRVIFAFCFGLQSAKPDPSLSFSEVIMPVNKARAARQLRKRLLQIRVVARIRDQPNIG